MDTAKTMFVLATALALLACQSTIGDAPPAIGSAGPRPDAAPAAGTQPDAAPQDAAQPSPPQDGAPGLVTLRQTVSDQILDAHSTACTARDNNRPVRVLENSFYRVFELDEEAVQGDLTVSSVQIGIQSATTNDNRAQPGTVRLHTLEGNLRIRNLTEIASQDIAIEPTGPTFIEAPISATVPAGSTLVVELRIPEASSDGTLFFIGSNDLGESAPGYLRAPSVGCDIGEPTRLADVDDQFADIHILLSVTGSY